MKLLLTCISILLASCASTTTGESVNSKSKTRILISPHSENPQLSKGELLGEIGDFCLRPAFFTDKQSEFTTEADIHLYMVKGRRYPVLARVINDKEFYDYISVDQLETGETMPANSEIGLLLDESATVRHACSVSINKSGEKEFIIIPLKKGDGKLLVSDEALFGFIEQRNCYSIYSVSSSLLSLYEHLCQITPTDNEPIYEIPYSQKSPTIVVSGVVLGLVEANPKSGTMKFNLPQKPKNLSQFEVNESIWGRE